MSSNSLKPPQYRCYELIMLNCGIRFKHMYKSSNFTDGKLYLCVCGTAMNIPYNKYYRCVDGELSELSFEEAEQIQQIINGIM